MSKTVNSLPISKRPAPDGPAWLNEERYLLEAGANSYKTASGYRTALRTFADWIQHYRKDGYSTNDSWPLDAGQLTTKTILDYRRWLMNNRSESTTTLYMAGVVGYLHFLDGFDLLPKGIQLQKLQNQLSRRPIHRNQAGEVLNLDLERQAIPKIVAYYDNLPLPPKNDIFNRRITLLRDRALVNVFYSTAARISEVVALDRATVGNGHANHAMVTGKGNKGRTLHIRRFAQVAIQAYLAERQDKNPALFISHSRNSNGQRLGIGTVHTVIKTAVRALGLHKSLSAHDFRHFRATQLLREGMPLEAVQEFLGHADIGTTRNIYAPLLGVKIVSRWLDKVEQSPEQALRGSNSPWAAKSTGDSHKAESNFDLPF